MSTASASVVESPTSEARPAFRRQWAFLPWVVIACGLLGTSGVVRAMQARRHLSEHAYREVCPLDLAKIPVKLGEWHLVEGTDRPLDQLTMRITGGSDHVVRTYANDLTGVSLMVLILFGPAEPVLPHVPAICYPSSGFAQGDYDSVRTVDYPLGKGVEGHALFQSASYFKPAGRVTLREAVYHSFRLDGEWSPFVGIGKRFPRRNPGVFKLQIQRQVAEGETLGQGDPIEQFIAVLLPEMEASIKASTATKGVASR